MGRECLMTGPKVLTLDVETSPNLAHVWGLWKNNVSLSQLQETGQVISFAAKWRGKKRVFFYSDFHHGHDEMVKQAHALMDEADAIVHYNGTTFDMPHLRREFLLLGMDPPSPHKDIDLLKTVKSRFRFVSNKLAHVTDQLGLTGKLSHSGHDLWVRCMADDPKAWAVMKKYNCQDVVTTEELYERLLPWISGHPHTGLYSEEECCGRCGQVALQKRGFAYTPLGKFQQYRCMECGSWSRSAKRLGSVDARPVQ